MLIKLQVCPWFSGDAIGKRVVGDCEACSDFVGDDFVLVVGFLVECMDLLNWGHI